MSRFLFQFLGRFTTLFRKFHSRGKEATVEVKFTLNFENLNTGQKLEVASKRETTILEFKKFEISFGKASIDSLNEGKKHLQDWQVEIEKEGLKEDQTIFDG